MALAGTLRQMNLEDVLRLIDEQRGAGLLVIQHGNLSAELHLNAGQILCVQRSGVGQSAAAAKAQSCCGGSSTPSKVMSPR